MKGGPERLERYSRKLCDKAIAPFQFANSYLQLQQGKSQDAVASFQAEEQHWPESKTFMDRMIQVASTGSKPASTQEH